MTEDSDSVTVDVLTPDEVEAAIQATLAKLGMTYDELAAEARTGDFRSEKARLTWFMVAPFLASGSYRQRFCDCGHGHPWPCLQPCCTPPSQEPT